MVEAMDTKKDPGKFTIRFCMSDPRQKRAVEELNAQGRLKAQFLTNAILHYVEGTAILPPQEELEPIRKRREELQKDIPYVYEVLKKGSEVARETAAQTLHEVRDAMKINYFDDMELIRSQAKKYE